jgi:hypothetical protein
MGIPQNLPRHFGFLQLIRDQFIRFTVQHQPITYPKPVDAQRSRSPAADNLLTVGVHWGLWGDEH